VLADELIALHRAPREVAPFTSRFPDLTPEAGYAAARELHAYRCAAGWQPVGRKIGFTNRTIWPRYGVYEPMWGTVYDQTLQFAQDDHATVPLTGLMNPRIEPEISFRLKTAPPHSTYPEVMLGAVDWIAHSIEIVQSAFPGWQFKLADCTAVNGLHGRLGVGTPVPVSDIPNLAATLPKVEVTLSREGVEVDRGVASNVLDSPLLAMAHLVEVLARQSEAPPLQAGEIITTGVITDAHPVAPGETWQTSLAGLPLSRLTVRFE
jgi:2-oxo-3-hexenedioate decarboxylase